jgi:hypothetical protein
MEVVVHTFLLQIKLDYQQMWLPGIPVEQRDLLMTIDLMLRYKC